MQSVEELCIKYVMDELDPSEKLLVEQKMKEDPNLLIEVECLKKTLKQLGKLPEIEPPAEVTERVMNVAREHARHPIYQLFPLGNMSANIRYWGAAAVLVLSVSLGSYFIFTLHDIDPTSTTTHTAQPVQMSDNTSGNATGAGSNGVQPWVDTQQILYIDKTNSNNPTTSNTDSAFFESMQKLTPMNSPIQQSKHAADVQLTRTIEPEN